MSNAPKASIIIPARFESTRYPGKPLALIQGVSMIERVWNIAQKSTLADSVYIATDSARIQEHAHAFGAEVIMTSASCRTGTDRVAEAAEKTLEKDAIVVSLQGDAVLTPPWILDDIISRLRSDPLLPMATPAVKLHGDALVQFLKHKEISPSSGTTVTFDKKGNALYFSKQPIPFFRNSASPDAVLYRHIGLYGYRFETLMQLQSLPESQFEKLEKLEQLRALENQIPISVVTVDYRGRSHGSVDTPKDVEVVEEIICKEGELIA